MTAQPHDKGYRSFPPEYFAVLDRVEQMAVDKPFTLGPFTRKDAQMGRRSFYRFRNALNEEGDKGDQLALRYAPVANLLKLEVSGEGSSNCYIVFAFNPVVAAMRRLEAAEHS